MSVPAKLGTHANWYKSEKQFIDDFEQKHPILLQPSHRLAHLFFFIGNNINRSKQLKFDLVEDAKSPLFRWAQPVLSDQLAIGEVYEQSL